jgi:hypothetical protein
MGVSGSNSHFGNSSLKSEARNPKSVRSPNPETRIRGLTEWPAPDASVSAFGFPPLLRAREGLGLRISELGHRPTLKMRIAGWRETGALEFGRFRLRWASFVAAFVANFVGKPQIRQRQRQRLRRRSGGRLRRGRCFGDPLWSRCSTREARAGGLRHWFGRAAEKIAG